MDVIKAFCAGGLLCLLAQLLIDFTKLTPARILTGAVVLGVILSGAGVYEYLLDFAGAGVTVPLVGFGHLMAEGVRKAVDEKGAIGILSGALSASSAGITAAIFFSLIASLLSKSRIKK